MNQSIIFLKGTEPFASLDIDSVYQASLIVASHPKRSNLFSVLKARNLPRGWNESRALGNITRKSLDALITANL